VKPDHVTQRLESRASPAAVDRGLLLLRDRAALTAFIHRLSVGSDVIAGSDRIAFALGPGDDCAWALVARDGGGVTCLAGGMAFTAPRVVWPAVAAFLREREEELAVRRALQKVKGVDDDVSPLVRMASQPHRLLRSEWDILRALSPILGLRLHVKSLETAVTSLQVANRLFGGPGNRGDNVGKAATDELWRNYVSGMLALTLIGDQRGAEPALVVAVAAGDVQLAGRGFWYFANQPAEALAFFEASTGLFASVALRTIVARILAIVAYRNPGFAKDALRLRSAHYDVGETDDAEPDKVTRAWTTKATPLLLSAMREDPLAGLPSFVGEADEDDEPDDEWLQEITAIWRPFLLEKTAPRVAPRPHVALTDDDGASATLWRLAMASSPFPPLLHVNQARLLSLAPIEAFLPGDEADALLKVSAGGPYLRHIVPLLLESQVPEHKQPVRAAPKTLPNAPCPCGSGKKWKKCHGKA